MNKPDFIEIAMRALQRGSPEPDDPASLPATVASHAPEVHGAAPPPFAESEKPLIAASALAPEGLLRTGVVKEKKSPDDLAAMIVADLSKVEGCPKRGVKVTVYGSNPWNSWLSFGVEAGTAANTAALQEFCEIITERLKRLYDVSN